MRLKLQCNTIGESIFSYVRQNSPKQLIFLYFVKGNSIGKYIYKKKREVRITDIQDHMPAENTKNFLNRAQDKRFCMEHRHLLRKVLKNILEQQFIWATVVSLLSFQKRIKTSFFYFYIYMYLYFFQRQLSSLLSEEMFIICCCCCFCSRRL